MAKNEADQAEDTQAAGASPDGKKKAAKKAKAPKKAEKSASANRGVWGLDLGQCGLKALRLEERGGQVVATHFDYIEHAKILSQPDADKDALIREALAHVQGDCGLASSCGSRYERGLNVPKIRIIEHDCPLVGVKIFIAGQPRVSLGHH